MGSHDHRAHRGHLRDEGNLPAQLEPLSRSLVKVLRHEGGDIMRPDGYVPISALLRLPDFSQWALPDIEVVVQESFSKSLPRFELLRDGPHGVMIRATHKRSCGPASGGRQAPSALQPSFLQAPRLPTAAPAYPASSSAPPRAASGSAACATAPLTAPSVPLWAANGPVAAVIARPATGSAASSSGVSAAAAAADARPAAVASTGGVQPHGGTADPWHAGEDPWQVGRSSTSGASTNGGAAAAAAPKQDSWANFSGGASAPSAGKGANGYTGKGAIGCMGKGANWNSAPAASNGSSAAATRRPGDWYCPKCKMDNFSRNSTCKNCNAANTLVSGNVPTGSWRCTSCGACCSGEQCACGELKASPPGAAAPPQAPAVTPSCPGRGRDSAPPPLLGAAAAPQPPASTSSCPGRGADPWQTLDPWGGKGPPARASSAAGVAGDGSSSKASAKPPPPVFPAKAKPPPPILSAPQVATVTVPATPAFADRPACAPKPGKPPPPLCPVPRAKDSLSPMAKPKPPERPVPTQHAPQAAQLPMEVPQVLGPAVTEGRRSSVESFRMDSSDSEADEAPAHSREDDSAQSLDTPIDATGLDLVSESDGTLIDSQLAGGVPSVGTCISVPFNHEWTRYDDPGGQGKWWHCVNTDGFFFEEGLEKWSKFRDPNRPVHAQEYWFHQDTEEWFYTQGV